VEADWDEMRFEYEAGWKALLLFERRREKLEKRRGAEARRREFQEACLVEPMVLSPEINTANAIETGEEAWDRADISGDGWFKLSACVRLGSSPQHPVMDWNERWGVDVKRVKRMDWWEEYSVDGDGYGDDEVGVGLAYWMEKYRGFEWWDEDAGEEVRGWFERGWSGSGRLGGCCVCG
jgi:hypothetical protein